MSLCVQCVCLYVCGWKADEKNGKRWWEEGDIYSRITQDAVDRMVGHKHACFPAKMHEMLTARRGAGGYGYGCVPAVGRTSQSPARTGVGVGVGVCCMRLIIDATVEYLSGYRINVNSDYY